LLAPDLGAALHAARLDGHPVGRGAVTELSTRTSAA
jgi:hypothetical protein